MPPRPRFAVAILAFALSGLGVAAQEFLPIPAGSYAPIQRNAGEPESVPVAPFRLARLPVTNGEYLEFVRANPKWRRSQVSRLFADQSYLEHWTDDLKPGELAPLDAPVVRVSWFSARAYARWRGLRLPTTAEWERAAAPGYVSQNGRTEPRFVSDLYAWLAKPAPRIHPRAADAKSNVFGIQGIHGLVWEWVDDFSNSMVTGESRADAGLERDLFCGAGSASSRDTSDYAAFMRAALRSSLKANNTTSSLGFRCAADATASERAPVTVATIDSTP